MENSKGLRIAVCQMKVIPGRPDLNGEYIIGEILSAIERKANIIVFPEMCVPGYLIGDTWEDDSFTKDIQRWNRRICEATKNGITAIFGSLATDESSKGEDGRIRKFNAAFVAQDGKIIGVTIKSLQPNYRVFEDDRHFFSMRKKRDEEAEKFRLSGDAKGVECLCINDYLQPISVKTKIGKIPIGVILCEDMWYEDYPFNPTKSLVENGAEIIFNLSASPWTWQKNRKRHKVVKDLISVCRVPLVYANNTGIQNSGKNIIVFDGSSTVYNKGGDIVFEVEPYSNGVFDFELADTIPVIQERNQDDTRELYLALKCAVEEFFKTMPPEARKVVIGLSGGIDSGLVAAFYAHILGPEKVIGINMPSKFSSHATKDIAYQIAVNLGIKYEVRPIQQIVDAIAKATGTPENSLAYENIQARVRMEILAAVSQNFGCVYSCNSNKVELAFGYGTLYGDMAGFMAMLGDLIKREVYQLADYMNRVVLEREVIPRACFEIAPSAELKENQKDPFDYGNLKKRGYHDETVRAFVEFRCNPEWFLEKYAKGQLENELKLEPGTLAMLFPNPHDFIADLEKNWKSFFGSYFKRVQSTPVPIVSKRAFGTDLRESMVSAHFTERYNDLKKLILARFPAKRKIVLFGGSFNPPHKAHRKIARELDKRFNRIFIIPCGRRKDKLSTNMISPENRMEMAKIAFRDLEKVELDLYDLENDIFTPTYLLQKRYEELFPEAEIWHLIGEDIVSGGSCKNSEIHRVWDRGLEIWKDLNFLVITRSGYGARPEDLPPKAETLEVEDIIGSGTLIRKRIEDGKSIDDLVDPEVIKYIEKNKLYRKK